MAPNTSGSSRMIGNKDLVSLPKHITKEEGISANIKMVKEMATEFMNQKKMELATLGSGKTDKRQTDN